MADKGKKEAKEAPKETVKVEKGAAPEKAAGG